MGFRSPHSGRVSFSLFKIELNLAGNVPGHQGILEGEDLPTKLIVLLVQGFNHN